MLPGWQPGVIGCGYIILYQPSGRLRLESASEQGLPTSGLTTQRQHRDSYFSAAGCSSDEDALGEFVAREDYAEALDRMIEHTSRETVDKD